MIGAVLGLLTGIGLASTAASSGLSLIGAPRIVTGLLAVLGVIIADLGPANCINTRIPTPRSVTQGFINPTIAVYTLVLSKALGLWGCVPAGMAVRLMSLEPYWADFLCLRRHRVCNRAS